MLYLTLRHYEYVTAIARAGSLSAAAIALNVSQPSLSNALDTIEARVGGQLFLRGRGKGVTITAQGRQFVAQAADILDRAQRLEHSGRAPVPRAEIGLGCFHDLAPFVLAPALARARATLPDTEVRPHIAGFAGLMDKMVEGGIDVAITWDIGLDARFSKVVLGHVRPHVFVAGDHPLAQRRRLRLADLDGVPLILSDDGLSQHHMIRLCAQASVTATVTLNTASIEVMRSLAARGEGVGISYGVPPGKTTYDGLVCVAIPIVDTAGVEPVVMTQLGVSVENDALDHLRRAFVQADFFAQRGSPP